MKAETPEVSEDGQRKHRTSPGFRQRFVIQGRLGDGSKKSPKFAFRRSRRRAAKESDFSILKARGSANNENVGRPSSTSAKVGKRKRSLTIVHGLILDCWLFYLCLVLRLLI